MPIVYVASWDHGAARASEKGRTVYGLMIPRRQQDGAWAWDELDVRPSAVHGLGVFPRESPALSWAELPMPILMPYLGLESVVQDDHLHRCLMKGNSAKDKRKERLEKAAASALASGAIQKGKKTTRRRSPKPDGAFGNVSALNATLDEMLADSHERKPGKKRASAPLTAKGLQRLVSSEADRLQKVIEHAAFQESPFAAVVQHLEQKAKATEKKR